MNYTNAADDHQRGLQGHRRLDGVFSGLMQYKGGVTEWPFNGFVGQYDDASWQYAAHQGRRRREAARHRAQSASTVAGSQRARQDAAGARGAAKAAGGSAVRRRWCASLLKPPPRRDETLQDPRLRLPDRQAALRRYTPEMVETGDRLSASDTFLKVAETILANSGADRTTSFAYAVAWTQHTNGVADHRLLRAAAASAGQYRPARAPASWRCAATPRSRARPTCRRSITRSTATWRTRRRSRNTTRSQDYLRRRRCRRATGRTCRSSWSRI